MPLPEFVSIALPLPMERLFTYALPQDMEHPPRPGVRVEVLFGARRMIGVVWDTPPDVVPGDVKAIRKVLDRRPACPASLMRYCEWVARYYLASIGDVLKAALPGGLLQPGTPLYARTSSGKAFLEGRLDAQPQNLSARERTFWLGALQALGDTPKPLKRWRKDVRGLTPERLAWAMERGWVRERAAKAIKAPAKMRVPLYVPQWERADLDRLDRAPRQRQVLEFLLENPHCPRERLLEAIPKAQTALKSLLDKGAVRIEEISRRRSPLEAQLLSRKIQAPPQLNEEQFVAAKSLQDAVTKGEFAPFLLHGVTGSGKTEVYLRAVETCLEEGKNALLLVPEIGLAPQLVSRVYARFGKRLALWHSGLDPAERADEWRRVRDGEARVVIGARSAVLCPLDHVGLIVVDEEHDSSYKAEDGLTYHARDCAVQRANLTGAVVVLGSATPSVETFHHARDGRYRRLTLFSRATEAVFPTIRLVDLSIQRTAKSTLLSTELIQALDQRLQRKEQAILLLNRRGFSPFAICRACREVISCPHCAIGMTYHLQAGKLVCHLCDAHTDLPDQCPSCGQKALELVGVGTQKLERELAEYFPEARVARLDRDRVRAGKNQAAVLRAFGRGDYDILLGTQMVAKGHDFENVSLVGIPFADQGLNLPDFRAMERTWQLLVQASGRAGRHEVPGEVIVQSWNPKHPVFANLGQEPDLAFYDLETRIREKRYPPFTRLAAVLLSSKDPNLGWAEALRLRRDLAAIISKRDPCRNVALLGPAPAPIEKIRDRWRFRLLARAATPRELRLFLKIAKDSGALRSTSSLVRLAVDVDPAHML